MKFAARVAAALKAFRGHEDVVAEEWSPVEPQDGSRLVGLTLEDMPEEVRSALAILGELQGFCKAHHLTFVAAVAPSESFKTLLTHGKCKHSMMLHGAAPLMPALAAQIAIQAEAAAYEYFRETAAPEEGELPNG